MFDDLISWENLFLAYTKAARGKRGREAAARFEWRLEDNLAELRHDLKSGFYRPGGYQSFYIHEPKKRLISAAPFRDRVVHHALCNLIEPIFERSFIHDSYANRIGKGTHRALDRAQAYARRFPYVLQLDIQQFFPSIDHAILLDLLARKLTDERVMLLCKSILTSGEECVRDEGRTQYFSGDNLLAALRPHGLPIGNLTSQFWGNVYLNGLDHFIKRRLRCPGYVRYVDDFLLFGRTKAELWGWRQAIVSRLENLRLRIHSGAHPKPVSEGIPFLGFVLYPDRRWLKRRKGVAYARRLRDMVCAWREGRLDPSFLAASMQGWNNHVSYGNTLGLRKAMFRDLPETLLAVIADETHYTFLL